MRYMNHISHAKAFGLCFRELLKGSNESDHINLIWVIAKRG